MTTGSPAEQVAQGFVPLVPLLRLVDPFKLHEAQRRLRRLERTELLTRYQAAFALGRRAHAYVMAEALAANGVPPSAWHQALHLDELNVNQRFDLFIGDLLWLRHAHAEHARHVRYRRCRAVLTAQASVFRREAEFMWYAGRRPVWKLVGSLSLTERQQWECTLLRSTPIKRRAATTDVMSDRVFKVLEDDVRRVRRTATFDEDDALATVQRRHTLWRCARMLGTDSAQQIAVLYEQLTAKPITRQAVAQQLGKVRVALAKSKMRF
jgi:hypothetical protein